MTKETRVAAAQGWNWMAGAVASPWDATPGAEQSIARKIGLTIAASLFVAVCARVTIPLPYTPVPLTLQNMAVLVVGLMLGSRMGAAAMALYLAEGAMGLPVFNPVGTGGLLQLFGATGGFLLAYPLVAWVAGYVFERGRKTFERAMVGCVVAELTLFAGGIAWLMAAFHLPLARAAAFGVYPFAAAEIMKVMFASAIASRLRGERRTS